MAENKKVRKHKFRNEYSGKLYAYICGIFIIVVTVSIIAFIAFQGIRTFVNDKYPIYKFIFSTNWKPDGSLGKTAEFGVFIFLVGSIVVSFGAIIISTPFAIALSIFMNIISPKFGSRILQPAMELFVGIPSVVYGWVGISILAPFLKSIFGGIGLGLLAAVIVLSIMILPTITSISSDAIKNVSKNDIKASYALGATRFQTIKKVIIPSAKSGISTGVVLGIARAFGEALAVQMVIGNSISFPKGILGTTSTLTSIITLDMTNTVFKTPWNNVLWSMALLLLIISFLFILLIRHITKKEMSK